MTGRPAAREACCPGSRQIAAFAGYPQIEAGWVAFSRTVADASTRVIGLAFAVNTAFIVLLQIPVMHRLEGRRRTRALGAMGLLWAVSWLVLGAAGR